MYELAIGAGAVVQFGTSVIDLDPSTPSVHLSTGEVLRPEYGLPGEREDGFGLVQHYGDLVCRHSDQTLAQMPNTNNGCRQ